MNFIYSPPNEHNTITMSTTQNKLGDFIVDVDGFYVFFPESQGGFYNEYFLKVLLDKLTVLNAEWTQQIANDIGDLT